MRSFLVRRNKSSISVSSCVGRRHGTQTVLDLQREKAEGLFEGELKGELKGQLTVLESLYQQGVLSAEQMNTMTAPLRQKLTVL
jgi:hypothetical protein